ncbi:11816_t:CDS:2, partial [Scutellospora calospora]
MFIIIRKFIANLPQERGGIYCFRAYDPPIFPHNLLVRKEERS